MDADLKSIAAARDMAEKAFAAYQDFLGTDPAHINAIVDAMARAIEPAFGGALDPADRPGSGWGNDRQHADPGFEHGPLCDADRLPGGRTGSRPAQPILRAIAARRRGRRLG